MSPEKFLQALEEAGFDYFAGVPDSLLKDFCACVAEQKSFSDGHIIAANEGAAVALAAGHYLATGRFGVVYMQNSGLGNAVNPLASLATPRCTRSLCCSLSAGAGSQGDRMNPST